MRILLTGGTGGLGREVVRVAEAAGLALRIGSRRGRADGAPAGREWARMDLRTGEGVADALAGADAVIHAASDPRRHAAVDVEGTRRLLDAARAAGLPHLVYISIVGVDDIPHGYYRAKLAAERMIEASGVPHSILRATQFHSLIDGLLSAIARVPLVLPLPTRLRFQTVDTAETADRLVVAVQRGPAGRLPDFAGPEVMTLGEMADAWKAARGVRKPTVRLPLPGAMAAAFRDGNATAHSGERGTVRWADWLRGAAVAP